MKDIKIEAACSNFNEADYIFEKEFIDELDKEGFVVKIYDDKDKERKNEIVIFSNQNTTLSQNIPVLDNLGLDIQNEIYAVVTYKNKTIYLRKYVIDNIDDKQWEESKENLSLVIAMAFSNEITNSPLNALAYKANLNWREIRLVKAIAIYEDQLISILSEHFIGKTLVKYSHLTKLFVEYFDRKFNPKFKARDARLKELEKIIFDKIKVVKNISEDRVLRIFFNILKAQLRTNYYLGYEQVAFKVDVTKLMGDLKGVQPNLEAFVYHPRFASVHLRRTKVSRGGIRYSDRYDDFRNEIRELMKAQRGKNSVIIPSGAKGGFVIYKDKPTTRI
jgi:glutamate dehydrogenase